VTHDKVFYNSSNNIAGLKMAKTGTERNSEYRVQMSAEKRKAIKQKYCKQQKKSQKNWTTSRKKKEAAKY
jgi:HKD family nuclease